MYIQRQILIHLGCFLVCLGSYLSSYSNKYVVDNLTDTDNAAAYTLNDGTNSLRKCIRLANANAGADTITFNSTLAGTISLTNATALPSITDQTVIDGTTALGAVAGTPTITIDGNGSKPTLIITGNNCVINTLCVIRSSDDGIFLNGSDNSVIKGCYVGVNTSGAAAGNAKRGILMDAPNASPSGANNNTIGGLTPAERNVIGSNSQDGINIERTPFSSGETIVGNYIGVGIDGATPRPNGGDGIEVASGSNSIIGGPTPGAGNIISANIGEGIRLGNTNAPITNVIVQGNYIGTNPAGINLGNGGNGIHSATGATYTNIVMGFSTNDSIPGTKEGNIIAFNGKNGINLESIHQTGNPIRGNSIYCNVADNAHGGGIDVGASDATPPQTSNGSVGVPIITNITGSTVSGTCVSGYVVHVYRNPSNCECEAEQYIGKAVTNGTNWSLTGLCLDAAEKITVIQTDPATNNTGPISPCSSPIITPNNAPVAINDSINNCIDGGSEVSVNVVLNDSDIDGNPIHIAQILSSTGGTASIIGDSTIKLIADLGADTAIVTYQICEVLNPTCSGSVTPLCATGSLVVCVNKITELVIPNLITPGHDTFNDVFVIKGILPNSFLEIYNRWGKLVYLSENYKNDWKPENESEGVYFFRFKDTVRQKEVKGWLHVVNEKN